jgi:hypothetical protein
MKITTLLLRRALLFCVFLFGISSIIFAQTFTDNAGNYSGSWTNNSNNSSPVGGLGAWSISTGTNTGIFIGNPSSNGMGTTGIGTSAFGMWSVGPSGYSNASRSIIGGMQIGDMLSFYWAINWDANVGTKGFDFKNGATTIFNVNNGGSPTITTSNGTATTAYGTTPMLVTLTRTSSTMYSFSMTARDGGATHNTTISSSASVNSINFYIGNQNDGNGNRNMYLNAFSYTKPDQYRSAASGNWSSAATWEKSIDGGATWAASGAAPGSTLGSTITIRNGHTVSQNQNYTSGSNNAIVVESGGTLNMTGALGDFQFNTMSVSGSVVRNHTSNNYVGAITVNNGGKYVHAINGGTIQSVTWNSGSTLEITGVTNLIPTATGTYQNVLWNCANQEAVGTWSALETNFNTVNGNFTIQNTGAGSLIIGNTATNRTMTVGGDFIISGGVFAIKGAATSGGDIKLTVNGNYEQSSGIFRPSRSVSSSTGTATLELKGNFTLSGGTFENSSAAGLGSVLFAKTGTQVYTKTGGTIASAINFTVNSNSTLSMGTNVLDGSTGTFTLSSSGGLVTGHAAGISLTGATGSIQVSGTRTYNIGANYTFNGTSAQVTGLGFTGANNLTINNSAGVTLSFSGSTSLAGTLHLTLGTFTVGSGNTITVANGGSISRTSGSLVSGSGAGTFTFAGTGTVTGTVGFNNVNIAGGVNFGTASTINGILTINSGGFVNTNSPTYATASTLKYNSGGTYGRGTEWSATTGAGYPHHVQISNNTTFNLANGSNSAWQLAGDLIIDANSSMSMEGLTNNSFTVGLTVLGNVANSGNITMATTTERLKCTNFTNNASAVSTLSSNVGGDLEVTGHLTENGNFNSAQRAVFFTGIGVQDIQGSGIFTIDYIVLNKASGSVRLLTNLLCGGPNGGNAMTLTNVTDVLDLNGNTITLGTASIESTLSGNGFIKGSTTSSISILGDAVLGTLRFDQSAPGTTNVLQNFTINRTSTGSLILGNGLIINGSLTLTAGTLSVGANTLNINGGVSRTSGTINASAGTLAFGNPSNLSLPTSLFTGTILNFHKTSGAGTLTLNDNIVVTNNMSTSAGLGALILAPSKQLTVQGALTNNGTFTMKDGATFVQATSGTSIDGTGTYTVEKALTDNNSTWSTTSGRFWYMGVPMVNVARDSYGTPGTTTNRVWSYSEATKSYTELSDGSALLSSGTGYVHRRSTDGTLTFTATGANGLYGSDYSVSGLTKTAGYTSGVNLVSNPYMGFLDWNAVYNASTNIDPTFYIRSNNTTGNNINALISYNGSTSQVVSNESSVLNTSNFRYIAPMQSIWVKVGAAASTGTVNMSRSMLSHQTGNTLKSSTVFPTLARVNLVDGNLFDQLLVYMNSDMSNEVDQYDSEKLPVSGTVQVYTMASNKKLVMNGLKNNKKKVSVPLYLELPETKSYTLQLSEYVLEDGLILLEDKQEGTMQDFTLLENYTFYANSGQLHNRFVLHFILPNAELTTQGPSNSWVGPETSYTDGGNVAITNDDRGNIEITVDQAEEQKVEGNVTVTDMNGKEVYKGQLDGITTAVSLNVPAGIYYLTVQSGTLFEKKKVFIQE